MAIRVEGLSSRSGVLILLLVGLLAPASVLGQENVVRIQFSYSDPGARSLGFGGAFVALADDATAAFANPAGLVQLLRPEISIEGRHWSYSSPYTEGGRVEGLPTGIGLDTTEGLRTATSEDDLSGLSFLSFVYPKGKWSLALFRHELATVRFSSETQGLFGNGPICCQPPPRFFDQRGRNDWEIVNYGLSTAYRISDTFSLGLGVVYYDASFVADAAIFLADDNSQQSLFGPNSYLPDRLIASESVTIDDTEWALTGGFLWRLSDGWSVGGVYRQGPELEIGRVLTAGETGDFGVPSGTVLEREEFVVDLPRIYGLGFAYRAPSGRFTASFQWDRIEYSNIVDSLGFNDRAIDDVDELHLGAEYVFLDSTPIIAVRLGTWLEPDHQIRATITEPNPVDRALLPPGEDDVHYSVGLGLAMQKIQIDLGVDFADRVDTVSLSAIYSF